MNSEKIRQVITRVIVASVAVLLLVGLIGAAAHAASDTPPHTSLYIVNADGSGFKPLRDDPNYQLWGPAYSPDRSKIAVTFVAPSGDRGELYLLGADGQHPMRLTHNGRNNYYPAWSHDGKRIAFISQQGKDVQTSEIDTINVDGSNEQQLTHNSSWDYGATWSPDDQQIAFGSEMGGSWQIWLMNADGTNQHPLPEKAEGNAPVWSPDGKLIAYKSDREGNDNIYLISTDGHALGRLTNDKSINSNPTWSPDGNKIAFWSTGSGTANIYVVNRDGNHPVNLVNNPGLDAELPSWSPDGKRIVFHASSVDTSIAAFVHGNGVLLGGIIAGVLLIAMSLAIAWRRRRLHSTEVLA